MNKIEDHLCDYGCGQKGKYYFKSAKKWCCSKIAFKCPAIRKKKSDSMKEVNKNCPLNILKRSIDAGELKCCYCDEPAKYITSQKKPCCSKIAFNCPDYSKFHKFSEERKKKMVELMIECQNRDSVKEKKRAAMKKLHSENCIPCVEFQENYKQSIVKRNKKFHIRNYNELIKHGITPENIPDDFTERTIMLNRERANISRKKLKKLKDLKK